MTNEEARILNDRYPPTTGEAIFLLVLASLFGLAKLAWSLVKASVIFAVLFIVIRSATGHDIPILRALVGY